MIVGIIVFTACATDNKKKSVETEEAPSILVAYFSAQGHTKALAEKIAAVTGGELFEIVPVQPYTEEDLDGWNESARGTRESKDRTTRPEVKNRVDNFEKYDTVYLGFPIWWYTAPTIINTFLETYNTEGKVIIPFATSGGSEIGETEKDLRVSAPKATFRPGKVLNNATEQQVKEWVNEN
ncbi:MAG: NAD(P)H-dependent oxidoreductase [Muribaculaceae bacterium]|nr:NAD(P)H-dependent oxidoreductase [Muribaculaceae bacterium]